MLVYCKVFLYFNLIEVKEFKSFSPIKPPVFIFPSINKIVDLSNENAKYFPIVAWLINLFPIDISPSSLSDVTCCSKSWQLIDKSW